MLALAACTGTTGTRDNPAPEPGNPSGEPISVRLPAGPTNIDPHTTNQAIGRELGFYTYDTLLHLQNGKIVSGLATAWRQQSPTRYEFDLTDKATCDDGHRLTAADIKANFDRVLDPKTGGPFAATFLGSTRLKVAAARGKLVVDLPSPNSDLLTGLTTFPSIICPQGLKNPKALATKAYGTGPWTLEKAVPGDHYTMKPRKDYTWGPGGDTAWDVRTPTELTLKVAETDSTGANLFLSGQLDITSAAGSTQDRLRTGGEVFSRGTSRAVVHLYFNQRPGKKPADARIRKALAQAVDRMALAKIAMEGKAAYAPSLILDSAPCYDENAGSGLPAYDPDTARRTLSGAGLRIRLLASSSDLSGEVATAEFLADAWKRAGVDVTIDTPDGATAVERLFSGQDWDVAVLAQSGITVPSILTPYFSGPSAPQGRNFSSIDNPEYTRISATALAATTQKDACAQWGRAEAALYRGTDVLPLYYDVVRYYGKGVSFDIGGFTGYTFLPTSFRVTR
ncbi:ABC transporter substrate-binding protein [Streptomyces sp. NPDC051018]|uniref:ABC transporter substrate-binding protein n=1 Tax=Streptomyces sp. NPDC051018 TaxID=3365639 RepID=UPI00378EBC06